MLQTTNKLNLSNATSSQFSSVSLAQLVDDLLLIESDLNKVLDVAKKLATKRSVKCFKTMGYLKAHIKYRIKTAKWDVTLKDDTIKFNV